MFMRQVGQVFVLNTVNTIISITTTSIITALVITVLLNDGSSRVTDATPL